MRQRKTIQAIIQVTIFFSITFASELASARELELCEYFHIETSTTQFTSQFLMTFARRTIARAHPRKCGTHVCAGGFVSFRFVFFFGRFFNSMNNVCCRSNGILTCA